MSPHTQSNQPDFKEMYTDLVTKHNQYKSDAQETQRALVSKLKAYENAKNGKPVIEKNGKNYLLTLKGSANFKGRIITAKEVIDDSKLQEDLIKIKSGLLSEIPD